MKSKWILFPNQLELDEHKASKPARRSLSSELENTKYIKKDFGKIYMVFNDLTKGEVASKW